MMIYGRIAKSKKAKVTKTQKAEYDAWLNSINSMSSGIVTKYGKVKNTTKTSSVPKLTVPAGRETVKYPSLNTGSVGTLAKTGIMNDYYKMSAEDRAKVDEINACVAPMHKSNYVYVSAGMNPAGLGRKNEVL